VTSLEIIPFENGENGACQVTGKSIPENERILIEPVTTPDGAACWRITRNGEAFETLVYETRNRAIQELHDRYGR
jgi:hypothetical protein